MRNFAFLILLIYCHTGLSQSVNLQWARSFGGVANDYGTSIAVDNAGNVYTVGYFSPVTDFDPGPGVFNLTSNGHFDAYISKLDVNGNFVWAKSIGGSVADGAISIGLDNNGNVYYAGQFGNIVDFDPGPGVYNLSTGANGTAAFISKLDANGNFQWARKFESTDLISIRVDGNGNVYSTGGFDNIVDFDPGPGIFNLTESSFTGISTGIQDVFVLKLDANGNFQWVKQMGGSKLDKAWGISIDGAGNIITTGHFSGSADFDPGPNTFSLVASGTLMDVFISKLDPAGNFVWAKSIGGTMEDYSYDAISDANGNIYLCGAFYSVTDFDPGPGQFDMNWINGRMFTLKLNSSGDFVWAKQQGNNSEGLPRGITLDAFGNVYTTGYYRGVADFDPGPGAFNLASNGYDDIFISKLDNNGNFVWVKTMGSVTNSDQGFDIAVDANRNVYTTGWFWGTVDFDPESGVYNLTMVDYGDAFVQKLSQCVGITYASINTTSCFSYKLNNQTYLRSGVYTQVLQNTTGCDSIITLNLTIKGSNDTLKLTSCNNYVWNSQTYTSSGFYRDTLTGISGCDSIINLDLTIRTSIATTINTVICEGQNYYGYTATGTYIDNFIAVNGCDSTRTLKLTVKPRAYSTLNISICQGETYAGYSTSGVFIDTLVSKNNCDSIRTINLVVNPTRTTNIQAFICEGASYFVGGRNQTISGTYRDTLQTYLGCDSIIITDLLVHPKPVANLGADRNLCAGESITFHPGTFASYQWQDLTTLPNFTTNRIGVYSVSVTDNYGCSSSDTVEIKKINPTPTNFLKPTDSICQYDKLTISPQNSYSQYNWSTGSRQSNIVIDKPGQYILTVKDINNCTGQDTITVIQKSCMSGVMIPTAFTPNGDQLNDIFRARVFGVVEAFNLLVYDRWGNLIFSTTDPDKGWNGTIKGLPAGTGVFAWQCSYKLQGEKQGFQKGTVTLIR